MAAYKNYRYVSASAALFLVVIITATNSYPPPLAQAQSQPTIRSAHITGNLCYTQNGTCTNGDVPIPGANVTVNSTNPLGITTTVGRAVTGVDGGIDITVPLSKLPLSPIGLSPITTFTVGILLPLNRTVCGLLINSTTGIQRDNLQTVGTFLNNKAEVDFQASYTPRSVSLNLTTSLFG